MGYCFDTIMTWRPVSCFAVSALLHLCALTITLAIMTVPFPSLHHAEDVLAVNLVGAPPGNAPDNPGSASQQQRDQAPEDEPVKEVKENEPQAPEETEAGVSFEADRRVSASYLDRLKTKIFLAWDYPEEAIRKGQQGIVRIMFVLDKNGDLSAIKVMGGSGSRSLDAASLDAVKQASPFGPLPKDISDKPLKITGTFCYVLD